MVEGLASVPPQRLTFLKCIPQSISAIKFRVVKYNEFPRTSLSCAAPDANQVFDHEREVTLGYLHNSQRDIGC